MEKIEITNLSITDFQRMLRETVEQARKAWEEEQKAPSDYEELTLEQAAKELQCCEATIRRKMIQLNISGTRIGKKILVQRKDLKKIRKAS